MTSGDLQEVAIAAWRPRGGWGILSRVRPSGCASRSRTPESRPGRGQAHSLCRLALGIIRWGHSGFVYLGRITRAYVSCASSFSVGGYLCLHMLAGGILLRFRLRAPRGHRRGRWFLLAAEEALKKFHLDTPISPERCFSPTPRSLSHGDLPFQLGDAQRGTAPDERRASSGPISGQDSPPVRHGRHVTIAWPGCWRPTPWGGSSWPGSSSPQAPACHLRSRVR